MRLFSVLLTAALVACGSTNSPRPAPDPANASSHQGLSAQQLAFFDYPLQQVSTLSRGGEAYPPHLGNYTMNPSIIRTARGDMLASYCRGISHGAPGMVAVVNRSPDEGRTWGNPVTDEVPVWDSATAYGASAGTAAYCASGLLRLRSGRILFATGDIWVPTAPSRRPRVAWSDDDGFHWQVSGSLPPAAASQTAFSSSPIELPNGDVWIPAFARENTSRSDPARMVFYVSHDAQSSPAPTWQLGPTIFDGIAQPMGSPLRRNWQEQHCDVLDSGLTVPECGTDSCWMCLSRSYDPEAISRQYSRDGGQTWSTPVDTFSGSAMPRWRQLRSGAIIVGTRSSDMLLTSVYRVSRDRGATWGPEVILGDFEQGFGQYVGLYSSGGFISGITADQSTAQTGSSRMFYFEISERMRTTGEVAPAGLQAWYDMGPVVANNPNHTFATPIPVWDDQTGHGFTMVTEPPRQDWQYRFGPTLNGFDGLPVLESRVGSAFQLQSPHTFAQPVTFFLVASTWVTSHTGALGILSDAPSASSNYFFYSNTTHQLALWTRTSPSAGRTIFYDSPNWTPGGALLTLVLNGPQSQVMVNGQPLTVLSGGPAGTMGLSQILVNAHGGDGLLTGLRELDVVTSSDAAAIARHNTYLMLKHGLH